MTPPIAKRRSAAGRRPAVPVLPDNMVDLLLAAQAPAALEAPRLARLRARVLAQCDESPYAIVPHRDEAFRPFIPGVTIRPLRVDWEGKTQTSLWRLQPGASIPPHRHTAEEECLIMEGSLVWAGQEYGPGDFLLARPGAHHEEFRSPRGALLMIRSELSQPLAALFAAAASSA